MSQAAHLERAFRAAGRAGLTRDEVGEIADPRFVVARVRALERKGFVFSEDRRFGRVWRWVLVLAPEDRSESVAEVEAEPPEELPLFDPDIARLERPVSAIGADT